MAVKIVNKANKLFSEVEKARYIHDEICRLANLPEDNLNNIDKTATGALIKKNAITLANGRTYCVDVTLDDKYNTHEWFLANFEIMRRNHMCE